MADMALAQAIVFNPLTVSPNISVNEAIACMSAARATCSLPESSGGEKKLLQTNARASCLLVMEDNRLVGIFTERDVVRFSADDRPDTDLRLADVMTRGVVTLRQSELTDIFVAFQILQQHRIRHLPVLNDQGELVGLLSHETLRQLLRPVDLLRLRVVSEIMTSQVIHASPDVSVLEIAQLMAAHRVSSVVIVEPQAVSLTVSENALTSSLLLPVGIVTEGDIVQFRALKLNFKQIQAHQVMSTPIFAVRPDDSLWFVQSLIQQKRLNRVVVTGDRGELLGIVTQSTLLQTLNPIEIYKLAAILEEKVSYLEAEKMAMLQDRTIELERQVQLRTTELKQQTKREHFLSTITTRIHASLELKSTLDTIVTEIQCFLQCDRTIVYQFNSDWSGIVVAEAVLPGWQSALRRTITDCCFQDKTEQLYAKGIKHAVSNIYEAGYPDCYIQLLEQYQVKANLVVPIILEEQLWGLLIAHQCEDRRLWEAADLDLLDRIAVQIAIAIQQSQAYEHTQQEIAQRRQAEAALRYSQTTQQAIIQGIPDLLIRTNSQGERLEFLSGGSVNVLYPPAGIKHPTVFDTLPEHLACQQLHYIQQAVATGQIQTYEQQIEVSGQLFWEEVRVAPLTKDEAIVIVRDITARVSAELERQAAIDELKQLNEELEEKISKRTIELRQSEERFRQVFEQSPVGIAISNLEGRLTSVNASFVQIAGYAKSELLQRPIQDILSGNGQQLNTQQLQQLVEQTLPVMAFESQIISGRGETVWVNATSALILNAFARPSSIVHLIENVSDRKQAETDLHHILKELSDFKYALDEAALVTITNPKGVITYVNERFCEISKYSREELIGNTHHLVNSGYHPKQFFTEMWTTINSGKTWRGEIQNRAKDNSHHWIDTTIVPFLNEQGTPIQYLAICSDITARKQAELNAEFLKQRLQFLLSSSPAVIYTCKTSGDYGVTSISENVTALLGYTPDAFLEDTQFWVNHLHPDDRSRVLPNLLSPFKQGHHYREYRFLHQNGCYRWIRDELRLIYDSTGSPIEIIGYFADITDLKQAERELKELTVSLQNAMEGISRLDKQGRYMTLNRAYANPCGYEPEELVGAEWPITVYPEDIPAMEAAYQTMLERGKVETEARGLRKDGSLFYKQVTMVTALDREGQFDGHYCFLKDISNRKATEAALKRQLAAIEAAIDGIAILEGDTYTYLNKSHLEMFGYEHPEELLGKSWTVLYSSEELARFAQDVFPILMQQHYWHGEAIAIRKDGSTFDEGLSLTLTESGALICVCRDITEQKQAEETIRQTNDQLLLANAELARATRLKDEFLANMSHELRTPLNAILGMAESLQEQVFGEINFGQERAVATIDRSGRHLLELINDILDLSKVESGKLELQIAPVSIKYLCETSLTFVRQLAVRKNIQLTAEIPASIPDTCVDERRIRQVLINLLNNAVKFTPEGGSVRLLVRQDKQEENCSVLFQVYDTGIGIAPENLSQLFQPFVQIDSSLTRQYAGTGLGLSLVQQLTQLHGGTVSVTSEVGQGSCFTVQIPDICILEHPAPPTSAIAPILHSASRTILVIEDVSSAVEQTIRYLAEVGLNTVVHTTGQGALEVAIEAQPALIILDILLPDLSGWDVLTQLKSHPQTQTIPVVIASVMDERSRAMALGAFDYLVKPINRDQVRSVLNALQISITPSSIPKSPQPSTIGTPSILLLEDNAANVATLSGYLKNRGFHLIAAEDGAEAIALAETQHPDLILMDIQMPKVDGLTVIRQIRANPAIAHIPIIALTALAMSGDREKCIEAGANEYMTKPVKLKLLVEVIHRLLSN